MVEYGTVVESFPQKHGSITATRFVRRLEEGECVEYQFFQFFLWKKRDSLHCIWAAADVVQAHRYSLGNDDNKIYETVNMEKYK